ncbi:hypothetical protein [Devosia elaeis]|uniref:Glycosyl hydrolase family 32 N-terminal domain-containing protein n=1 Tax=Devosia elaeis TaxID=1770058 RepID=A0A178HYF5_9HYPH|nr:hypothetical protein [Devosia elaeis]OAM77687.1 hypothetical protein A3840_08635 [Devosia elaeis]
MRPGVTASAGKRFFVRDFNVGLLPIEQLVWQRIASPVFQKNSNPGAWDSETMYYPVLARNLDRSLYQDAEGNFLMYYTGNDQVATDFDEGGLALGSDLDTWVRFGSAPVLPLGGAGDPDAGDAQITSVYFDGSEFIVYYQGNATPPEDLSGDNVTICLATSTDGKVFTKQGMVLGKGANGDGDFDDMYRPKLVPAGHDGLPKLYYTGQQTSAGPFGLMGATSTGGSLKGPWTKLGTQHMLGNPYGGSLFFLEDAWYEDGLYYFIYIIGGSTPGGLWLATSEDGVNVTMRRQLLRRNPGEWDASPSRGSYYEHEGMAYLFYDAGGSAGIGYSYATLPI